MRARVVSRVATAEIGTEEIVVPDTVEELLGGTDTKA